MALGKGRTTADDVRKVALAALTTVLDDGKQEARSKPGLTGVRAVATGAVLYTVGKAALNGRRFVRNYVGADAQGSDVQERDGEQDGDIDEPADEEYDEPKDEEFEEPEAEGDEDSEDEEFEEPEAEEDEESEDEEFEEPQAEEDEDSDEDESDADDAASRRPPVHAEHDSDDELDPDLPDRPSRSRAPVGRA